MVAFSHIERLVAVAREVVAQNPIGAILKWLEGMTAWLVAFGPLGALLIGLIDSFVPLPGGSDLAVIGLSVKNPAIAPLAVLAASVGSVTGSTLVYLGARRAGVAALARIRPERRERVEHLLGKYDVYALGTAAFLPPPFPFKVFNIVAGVIKIDPLRVILALAVGRVARFSIEAALAVAYGEHAIDIIKQHGLKVLGVALLVALGIWGYKSVAGRRARVVEE
jgi:membrane protein YqaA with SNARE-associated domain